MIRIKAQLVSPDGKGFQGYVDNIKRTLQTAITAGVTAATEGLKTDLRAQVEAASLGDRLPNAIRSQIYPTGGRPSLHAAGFVWPRGKGAQKILDAFSRGVTIRGKDGNWLAIPTEAAGKSYARQRITPALWEQKTGIALKFIYRPPPLPSLLVAELRAGQGKRGGFRAQSGKAKASGRNAATVVIFILLDHATLRKRLNPEALAKLWSGRVPTLIEQAMPRKL